jgi:hypothetical protein
MEVKEWQVSIYEDRAMGWLILCVNKTRSQYPDIPSNILDGSVKAFF